MKNRTQKILFFSSETGNDMIHDYLYFDFDSKKFMIYSAKNNGSDILTTEISIETYLESATDLQKSAFIERVNLLMSLS